MKIREKIAEVLETCGDLDFKEVVTILMDECGLSFRDAYVEAHNFRSSEDDYREDR